MERRHRIRNIARALLIPVATYIGLYSVDLTTNFTSHRIKTQQELVEIIKEEANKLDLNREVVGKLENKNLAHSLLTNDTIFLIMGGSGANSKYVRHELYHWYREGFDDPRLGTFEGELKYWFVEEPSAIIYSLTGLKI